VSEARIFPLDEPSWTVDPEEWLSAVQERWPGADVWLDRYPSVAAVAVLPSDEGPLEADLLKSGPAIVIESLLPAKIAEFVEWWARRLPSYDTPVHFFPGENFDHSLPLGPDTTAEDVLAFMNHGQA
jgi:hypothetical protein